jgi:predicted ATPase/DNA-binding winged helix-turn-helix (wHTH) protein
MSLDKNGVRESLERRARTLCFGPYRLSRKRTLLKNGTPVPLGTRAMEILLALAERAGQMVAKRDLMVRVWPGTVVDEPALRFQVATLRKALSGGKADSRYIQTVSGLGYRFVAPVTAPESPESLAREPTTPEFPQTQVLTAPSPRMIGRSGFVNLLSDWVPKHRLITLTGPGGVGKTMVAVASVERLRNIFGHEISFIDFASLTDASLVPRSVARALGLADAGADPVPHTIAFLKSRRMLLVLDTCEHVADSAARFVERVVNSAPRVCIIATSREALRARGEWVKRLPPLPVPPPDGNMTAAEVLEFPSVELFRERAVAAVHGFELADVDVPAVVELCRRLDGIPLAIELAAAHLHVFGVRGLNARMEEWLQLHAGKRGTVNPRHETLWALIEWSFHLLPRDQQIILRRLSVLSRAFREGDARILTSGHGINAAAVSEALAGLVAKSLITADPCGRNVSFRLLETVRAHARMRLAQSLERSLIERRYALLESACHS